MEAGAVHIKLMADISNVISQMQATERIVQQTMGGIEGKINDVKTAAKAMAVAFVAGMSVSAFVDMFNGSVKAAAGLHDLAIQGSTTVEALSGLAGIGKYSDTAADTIVASMNKLTRGLTSATEESAGTGKAIQALGLDMEQFRNLKPEEQMIAVSKAMDGFQDGAGKSAVMMALYGKEGAKLLPFMKDLAVAGDLQAKITTAQAAAADNFDDNLLRLKTSGEGWKKELMLGIIPAMDEAAQAYLDVMNGSGGLRDEIKKLSADGSITEFARGAIIALTYLQDMVAVVWRGVKTMAVGLPAYVVAAQQYLTGNFAGASETMKALSADLTDMWSEQTIGQRLRARLDEMQSIKKEAEETKKAIDTRGMGKSDSASGKVVDDYAKLIEKIREKTAVSNAELTQETALSEGQKMAIQIMEQLTSGKLKLTDVQKAGLGTALEAMLAAEGLSEAHKAQVKATKEAEEAHVKYLQTLDSGLAKLDEEIAQQRLQNAQIGLTKDAVAALAAAREYEKANLIELQAIKALDRNGDEVTYTLLMREAAARRELAGLKTEGGAKEAMVEEAKKSAAAWDKFYDSVYNGLTDSLFRAFEAGKGFFSTFWSGIKNLFKTTVLKLMVQGVVGGTLGSLGLPASANAGGAQGGISSSMLSTGMDWLTDFGSKAGDSLYKFGDKLYNMSSGTGPLADFGTTLSANSSTIGQTMGQLGDGLGYLNAAVAISKGKWGEGIGSAVGTYFGGPIGAAIGSKIGSWVDSVLKGGETRSGGSYLMDSNGQAYKSQGPSGGEIAGDAVRTSINQAYTGINSMLKSFGSTSSVTGFTAGLESSKNGKGFQYAGGYVNGKGFGEYLGRDGGQFTMQSQDEATAAKNFNSRLQKSIIQALQTADLDGKMGEWLKTIGDVTTATDAQTAVLLDAAVHYQQFSELIKQTPFDYLSEASVLSADAILVLTGGIESFGQKLGTYYDNYYSESEKTAKKTNDISKELSKVGLTMPATREEFRKLVEAQDLTTAAGANAYATLMNVNQAFAELVPAAQEVQKIDMTKYFGLMKDQASLQVDLLKAQGRESDALALKRSQETAGMTLLEWAAAQANYAIEDQIAALEKQRQVLKDNQSWQDKLDVMTGTRTSRQVQQANDLASATDDTTKALIGQYYAQLDAADAANALAKVLKDNQAWQDKLDVLTGARTDRQVAEANDLASATDESTKALIRQYYAQLDAADASKTLADQTKAYADTATQAYQSALTAQQSYLQGLINFGKSVKDFLRGLDTSVNAGTSPSSRLNAARDQYIADLVGSRAGDADAFSRLTNSAQTYMTAGTEMYASGAQQQAIIAQVKAELGGLAPVMQIDKNLEQLARIESAINTGSTSQVSKLTTIAANTYGLDELARIRTIVNALDWTPGAKAAESTGIMAALSKQNGWGIGTLSQATGYTTQDISALFAMYGITSLPGATAGTTAATTPVTAPATTTPATPVNAGQAIDNLVQSLNWDAAHTSSSAMTMYGAAQQNGWTQLMIAAAMGLNVADVHSLFDSANIPRFAVGTNYVPKDMLAQIHEGEAIIPKAYNPAAMPMQQDNGNAALLAELRSLRREVITLQAKVAEGVAVETGLLNHQVAANNESINRIGRVATATEATAKTAALEAART